MTTSPRRAPVLATLIVLAALATMVWLGVWQLQRARWKEGLLARYAAAEGRPVLDGLPDVVRRDPEHVAFRRARVQCAATASGETRLQIGGRNRAGATGYRNIAECAMPGGQAIMLDNGWSPPGGRSVVERATPACAGPCPTRTVIGRLIPDPQLAARMPRGAGAVLPLLLVADQARAPLQPSVPPSIADIPNNHRAYAVQWFLFAAVAFTVYLLALRRRAR